jgi:hypothetical protein
LDALLAAFVSAVFMVFGTELLQVQRQRRELKAQADRKLVHALSEFGFALDALILELEQLPATRGRSAARWTLIERHAPATDFFLGRLARLWFGRDLYAAIERMQKATNDLLLIAPPAALEALQPVFDRLSGYADREGNWFENLQRERSEFAERSRSIAYARTPHLTKAKS